MRCPLCGKVYPANVKNCSNHTCKKQALISESEYNKQFHPVKHKTYKDIANEHIKNKKSEKQIEYMTHKPKCPICGSENLKKLSALDRGASAFVWGLGSNKIGKTYQCKNCKATF